MDKGIINNVFQTEIPTFEPQVWVIILKALKFKIVHYQIFIHHICFSDASKWSYAQASF